MEKPFLLNNSHSTFNHFNSCLFNIATISPQNFKTLRFQSHWKLIAIHNVVGVENYNSYFEHRSKFTNLTLFACADVVALSARRRKNLKFIFCPEARYLQKPDLCRHFYFKCCCELCTTRINLMQECYISIILYGLLRKWFLSSIIVNAYNIWYLPLGTTFLLCWLLYISLCSQLR